MNFIDFMEGYIKEKGSVILELLKIFYYFGILVFEVIWQIGIVLEMISMTYLFTFIESIPEGSEIKNNLKFPSKVLGLFDFIFKLIGRALAWIFSPLMKLGRNISFLGKLAAGLFTLFLDFGYITENSGFALGKFYISESSGSDLKGRNIESGEEIDYGALDAVEVTISSLKQMKLMIGILSYILS